MTDPSLDIIIVNYNSTDYLLKCLESIYANVGKVAVSVIVIENNSQNHIDRVEAAYPQVILIRNTSNVGFAAAINQGVKISSSKYLLFLNPDTYLMPIFFRPMLDYMESHPHTGILGPKILDTDGTVQGSARAFPNALTALYGRSSPITKYFPNNLISRSNIMTLGINRKSPMEVDWVSGACMMVRRQAIEEVGEMDEHFFMYWEDADLCRRMWENDWKVIYLPGVSLYHHIGKSSDSRPLRSIYHFHRSSFLLFDKHAHALSAILKPFVLTLLFLRCLLVVFLNLLLRRSHATRYSAKVVPPFSVLHIITRLIVGGAQENTILTAELLDKKYWDVDVMIGPQTGPEGSLAEHARDKNVKLYIDNALVREINPFKDFLSFLKMVWFIRKKKYSIVHTHSSKAGISGRWAAWLARIPVIIHTVHGWGFHEYQKPWAGFLFKFLERTTLLITDKLIVVTRRDIDKGLKANIGTPDDYTLIRSGIELAAFANPLRPRQTVRKEFGIPMDAVVIGTVTRLSPQKSPLVFIEAAHIISNTHPNVYFLVVGDGPLRNDVEQRIKELKLGDRICLTGLRRDVPDLLSACDIFTLSSLWEGLPRVLPQAMANGLPVVASAIDGSREIIQDAVNGRLFPPGNHTIMAKTLIELIEDPGMAKNLAAQGHKSVEEYDVNRMVDKITDLYRHQLARKSP